MRVCSFIRRFVIVTAGLFLIAFSTSSISASRHALIIGNSDYEGRYRLFTPLNDSNAIAEKLSSIGYKVHGGGALHDLDLDSFNQEIDSFLSSVEDGSSTLVYYAGHGAASRGTNYLIPILPSGVTLRSDSDIRDRSISLQSVLERVENKNQTGVNVFFFDACRDAPVASYGRAINLAGLTNLEAGVQPRGSFIGFSTEYGKIALDGKDPSGYSPFAAAVLIGLEKSATTPIELFYKQVTAQVYDNTSGRQFPVQESKLRGDYCIIECSVVASNSSAQEFGTLMVDASPLDAEVCFLIDAWKTWTCGQQMTVPLYENVKIRATAKNHKTYTTTTRMTQSRQQLSVELEPKEKGNTMKIIGGVAAAILVTGVLLSSDSDSGGSETYSITLNRP